MGNYDYYDSHYESSYNNNLSAGAIVGIVLASIFLFVLKIMCCYWRFSYRRRPVVITRRVSVVVVENNNPRHVGYDQERPQPGAQPTRPPPYAEAKNPHHAGYDQLSSPGAQGIQSLPCMTARNPNQNADNNRGMTQHPRANVYVQGQLPRVHNPGQQRPTNGVPNNPTFDRPPAYSERA